MKKQNLPSRINPVILCGGSGTRLWPLSRESYPKQFVDLGGGRTLFRDTLLRTQKLAAWPIIVCNENYRFYVANELRACESEGEIIVEPAPRNTAPATALAALALRGKDNDEPMLVLPSDHYIEDADAFCGIVRQSLPLALAGSIVIFGIEPTGPATGFGYIRRGEKEGLGFKVREFIEKPDENKAAALLVGGECSWNAGIFLLRPSVYLAELERYAPKVFQACAGAWKARESKKDFISPGENEFLASPEDSIDYAVMEHTDKAVVVPMKIIWDDLGSWESFFQCAPKDENNNACEGEVILDNVRNCYLRANDRLVAAIGITDIAVVETRDAVLVARRQDAQKVKGIVSELKKQGSNKYRRHPLVYRPWGSYEILSGGDRFLVKRVVVNPGEFLSLQIHHHRAEHWIVVSGTAEVTKDGETRLITENQSTYIPIGAKHRLRNPGIIPLVMIEIQSGSYLGEDDIVRLEENCG